MSTKVPVTLNGISFEAQAGETLLEAAGKAGVGLAHLCFGNALCATCRVEVVEGMDGLSPQEPKEKVSLNYHLCFDAKTRLACQAKVVGPAKVTAQAPAPFSWIAPRNRLKKEEV